MPSYYNNDDFITCYCFDKNVILLKDISSNLISLYKEQGFLTYGDLQKILDVEVDNPFTFYLGNKDKYYEWITFERGKKQLDLKRLEEAKEKIGDDMRMINIAIGNLCKDYSRSSC